VESCLYEGRVRHLRRTPVRHAFEMPLFLTWLDLAELPRVFAGRWLWSTTRPAPARFRREDHWGDPSVPLDRAVRDLVEGQSGERPEGPIRLLTHLRFLGYVFNPVSFYYCFDRDEGLRAVVAEVTNIPWKERHCYVLVPEEPAGPDGLLRLRTPKAFHVSPFLGMDAVYHWRLSRPGRELRVHIASHDAAGNPFFDADLRLSRREITTGALARVGVRYPWMTAQVVAGIYWQALRLRRRGVPVHPHPREREARAETTP